MFHQHATALLLFLSSVSTLHLAVGLSTEANIWFWGCYGGGDCNVVPDHIWSLISEKRIATGVFPGFGHSMHGGGEFAVAGQGATDQVAKLVAKAHAIGVTVRPIIEYWDKTSLSYKLFVRNTTQQDKFIEAFVQDAVANHYDGYNLDWEFGDYNETDERLMGNFLTKFAKALAPHGMQVSTCQGDMRFASNYLVNLPNYLGYSMGTYSASFKEFLAQLSYGTSWRSDGKSDLAHFGVGFSASSEAWKVKPTVADLKERFCALYVAGVKRIALYGGDFAMLDQYVPFLQDFVVGKPSFGGPCLHDVVV
mmetsp:Transcript_121970/g.210875  ORF Transcript_121970/g.210875 Transcript_121970/m.210875 type:complete len:308 (+) Transcript_121970:38-961(+)